MSEIKLTINKVSLVGNAGQTILEIARAGGIDIPTLCHDERIEAAGSCGICVVEAEGVPKLLRACATIASEGMVIFTDSERIRRNRKMALELLLSDHTGDCLAPCTLACPAQTNCQGYVDYIATGKFKEAYELIMDKVPLPASIGRVCPHPCEDACRRELVEEPIAIMNLKQFVGDLALADDSFADWLTIPRDSGKKVAIVGGGPGGLSAAYYLRLIGHAVTVYDAMPFMGGMLRYGIPEYRLPNELLQKEIEFIEKTGVTFRNNVRIGRDVTFAELQTQNDAVIVAIGAWTSTGLRCPGEEADGVLGGIYFLRDTEKYDFKGKSVAIVGGGNTAMDACRTAVRLGADNVYNIYRRTRDEMPAEEIEIVEAIEEGVIFKNLTNPIEIIADSGGTVSKMRLQIMELGEMDASGRRSPVPVEGKEEVLDVDIVIAAIGQKPDVGGFETIERTRWGTLVADEHTFCTNVEGVFAIGDATNDGADIAISAIGDAKKAVEMVDRYLNGEKLSYKPLYLVKDEKAVEDFADRDRQPRAKMPHRSPAERKLDFKEVNLGMSADEVKREGERCLACGCLDYSTCKLIKYANSYDVQPEKFEGAMHCRATVEDIPNIMRTPDKCVLCGLCVRLCEEAVGAGVLGFVNRGFDTVVQPAGSVNPCYDCGQCAEACPTGALIKHNK